ncbi:MAG: insulinase family protein [Clostridia bacterium]|nr:insulinase family protein [Clostridia bacterium]
MYQIDTLPNGVRIISEQNPNVRSVSLGVWIASGTRHEPTDFQGASHFIEHMLFKGTDTVSAAELADRMDALGGEINAFTTKECTCFYGRVLDEKLTEFSDMLADMLFCSRFDEECVEIERGVIYEEIGMCDDTPDDLAIENLLLGTFRDTPLGVPILGTRESLKPMTGKALRAYKDACYTADAVVISLSGHFSETDLAHVRQVLGGFPVGTKPQSAAASYRPARACVEKPTEQNNIVIGFPALSYLSEQRYAMQILNNIVGGNMSSRLFQRVREQLGLCYSVHSFLSTHSDCGVFAIYIGTGAASEQRAMTEIGKVLAEIVENGVTDEEVTKVCDSIRSALLMSMESTSARMNHMGKGLLLQNAVLSPDEVAAKYLAVTKDEINALAREMFRPEQLSLSAVTAKGSAEAYAQWVLDGLRT